MTPHDRAVAECVEEEKNLRATKDLAVLQLFAAAVRYAGAVRKVEWIRRAS